MNRCWFPIAFNTLYTSFNGFSPNHLSNPWSLFTTFWCVSIVVVVVGPSEVSSVDTDMFILHYDSLHGEHCERSYSSSADTHLFMFHCPWLISDFSFLVWQCSCLISKQILEIHELYHIRKAIRSSRTGTSTKPNQRILGWRQASR